MIIQERCIGDSKYALENHRGQLRNDSDYVYIRHYMKNISIPLWVLFNALTIDKVIAIYSCQKGRTDTGLSQIFGLIKINEMIKMLAKL